MRRRPARFSLAVAGNLCTVDGVWGTLPEGGDMVTRCLDRLAVMPQGRDALAKCESQIGFQMDTGDDDGDD